VFSLHYIKITKEVIKDNYYGVVVKPWKNSTEKIFSMIFLGFLEMSPNSSLMVVQLECGNFCMKKTFILFRMKFFKNRSEKGFNEKWHFF